MNHRVVLAYSLTLFLLIFASKPLNAATASATYDHDAVFGEEFDGMNIPDAASSLTSENFEKITKYLLENKRHEWLSVFLERGPEHYFTSYARFAAAKHFGDSDLARRAATDFCEGLKKELAATKTAAARDDELAEVFAWLREHEFDTERAQLDELCAMLPHNFKLRVERLRWIDWLDGKPTATEAIRKIAGDTNSDLRLLTETATIYNEWYEPDRATRLLIDAWRKAQNDSEIWIVYDKSNSLEIPALAKKLASRILKKDKSISTLKRLFSDNNISLENLTESCNIISTDERSSGIDKLAAADLLLEARERRLAVKIAESTPSEDNLHFLIREARLFDRLLNGEVEQEKLKSYGERRAEAIRRLSDKIELRASEAYRIGAMIKPENSDPQSYKQLRPLIEKLRGKYRGAYMQLQELRLLQQAGKYAEVLAGLHSLFNQYSDKPLLQLAVISEAVRFLEDGLDDGTDGHLRNWCEGKAMASSDAARGRMALLISAALLDRMSKHAEATNIRQKLASDPLASADFAMNMSNAMFNKVTPERVAGVLGTIKPENMDIGRKLKLIGLLFRCYEQERATSLKYNLSKENEQISNLVLARRLFPHFEKFRKSLKSINQPARISLDVFTHQITMSLQKHCENPNVSKSDIEEAFSILRRMHNEPRISNRRLDSEMRYYLWENSATMENTVHYIFEKQVSHKEDESLSPGTAAELARLSSDDFLEVLSSQLKHGAISPDIYSELIQATATKDPVWLPKLEELIDKWKSGLELKSKASEFFEMALNLNSAALAMKKRSAQKCFRYRKIINRMESEVEFLRQWRKEYTKTPPAKNTDKSFSQWRLEIRKDPRQHIMSAAAAEAALTQNAWVIEHCFELNPGPYSTEFKGFILSDQEGFVENADIYNINSSNNLQKCIIERMHAVHIEELEAPFAFARLDFSHAILKSGKYRKGEKDFGLRMAELEALKIRLEKQNNSWSEWPAELSRHSDALLQLSMDINSDAALHKQIAGWLYINGREEEARHMLRQALWMQAGDWIGVMAAVLAALWLAAYIRRRRHEKGRQNPI